MSARIPVRRLGQASLAFRPRSTQWATVGSSRSISLLPSKKPKPSDRVRDAPEIDPNDPISNPMLHRWLEKQEKEKKKGPAKQQPPKPGTLSKNPLFHPEYRVSKDAEDAEDAEEAAQRKIEAKKRREYELHASRLDPVPNARRRLERKLVIMDLSRHRRVTKATKLARTERQLLFRSQNIPTSTKKLTHIMRLIAGKTVEEALVQLRFSKKRIARDVHKGLQIARDQAIAERGMGLGPLSAPIAPRPGNREYLEELANIAGEAAKTQAEVDNLDPSEVDEAVATARQNAMTQNGMAEKPYMADGTNIRKQPMNGPVIELKDGSKKRIYDPTEIYIDQAWVGKGMQTLSSEQRARGVMNRLTHRTSSFSVLLKEEKTRMRVSEEIKKKRDNRKLWLPLPDRPVTSQRQYCLW